MQSLQTKNTRKNGKTEKNIQFPTGFDEFSSSPFGLLCPVLLIRIYHHMKASTSSLSKFDFEIAYNPSTLSLFLCIYYWGNFLVHVKKIKSFNFFSLEQSFLVCQILLQITRDKKAVFCFFFGSLIFFF